MSAAVQEWRCATCGSTDGPHFDRSLCACGSMHYYCGGCGVQDDSCDDEWMTVTAAPPAAGAQPGEPCPTCSRRVPFPKTEKTPPTKKKAYWVPVDEHEAHEDVLETAAKHLGTFERPFWEFATVTLALALVLQDENLRGFAHRNPHSREYEVPDRAEPETQGLA